MKNTTLTIIVTFICAIILTILPMPNAIGFIKPQWLMLVLICWSLILPSKVSVGIAWLSGIFLDILENSMLGEHALIFTIIIYILIKFHARINFFTFLQKALIVLGLVFMGYVLQYWIEDLNSQKINKMVYFSSCLITAILWPWAFALLTSLTRRVRIN